MEKDLHNTGSNVFESSDNRLSQTALLQPQFMQQQQATHQSDHGISNNLFGVNMSKFFDFHKNQQQQQMQQFILHGGHNNSNGNNGSINDQLRLNTLLENNRINSQFLDQNNGHLSSQHQLHKQRLKYDATLNGQQTGGQQNQQSQQQVQQNRIAVPNQFSQNSSVDDDLGFDPFIETQKALAELMENELVQQQNANITHGTSNSSVAAKLLHQQQQRVLDNMQRSRMPPPGFNHMTNFGFGIPRTQSNSKILPFVNTGNSGAGNTSIANGCWNSHLTTFPQHPHQLNETQIQLLSQNQTSGNPKVYGNNDWTTMDPAILSFRQFSFPQQTHMSHPQQQDFFLQNMAQHHNIPGFSGSQTQLHCGNINMPNSIVNGQQVSPGQVNANVQGMLEYLKNRQFM